MPRFDTSDGLSLYYEDEGQGLPLLCLAGLTRNPRDFDDLGAVRPEGTRMIRLATRGREPSDHAKDPAEYAVPVEARDALELLDHLGLERAVVIGTSRGGLIGMFLAAVAKERLLGVLLNDIGPVIEPLGLGRIYDYVGRRPAARTYGELAGGLAATMSEGFPTLGPEDWRRLAERWFVEDAEGIGLRYDARLAEPMLAARDQPQADLWPLFDAMAGLPVACIRGMNSDLLSAETVAEMARRHPGLIVAEVPDRGHVPFLDEPESLAALDMLLARVREAG